MVDFIKVDRSHLCSFVGIHNMETKRLNRIAQDLVLKQVIQDKYDSQTASAADRWKQADTAEIFDTETVEEIDDDTEIYRLRELKINKFKEEQERLKRCREMGNGSYRELTEAEFAKFIVNCRLAVCHFFEQSFSRCKIMDSHLTKLAPEHVETAFLKINACKAQFFTAKLGIRVLPSLVLFVDGNAVRTLVGFDAFGAKDSFKTSELRRVLFKYKAIEKNKNGSFSDNSDSEDY